MFEISNLDLNLVRRWVILLQHEDFIKHLIEGKVECKREQGQPRISYQIKMEVGAKSYKEVK